MPTSMIRAGVTDAIRGSLSLLMSAAWERGA
jgi:hypothetical protein